MEKTVTLRLPNQTYQQFLAFAEQENRPLPNFIETIVHRYMETQQFVDEFEMEEIASNAELDCSLRQGIKDAEEGRGRFV